jgi:hypothetical protein
MLWINTGEGWWMGLEGKKWVRGPIQKVPTWTRSGEFKLTDGTHIGPGPNQKKLRGSPVVA